MSTLRQIEVAPPRAVEQPVVDEHFGFAVRDPYRWMENWRSAEFMDWLDGQGNACERYLSRLPAREALRAEVAELTAAVDQVTNVQVVGDEIFFLRRAGGSDLPSLVVRSRALGSERVLVEPHEVQLAGMSSHVSIDWYTASPDGRHVAYCASADGSELGTLHVHCLRQDGRLPVALQNVLPLRLTLTMIGGVFWLPDGSGFLYHRLRALAPRSSPTELYRDSATRLHTLGGDGSDDIIVLARGTNPRVALQPDDYPLVTLDSSGAWAVATILHGSRKEQTLYIAPADELADPAACTWIRIADPEDEVTAWSSGGGAIYLLSRREDDNGAVVSLPLSDPRRTVEQVVPPGPRPLEDLRVAGLHLLLRELERGRGRLRRVDLEAAAAASEVPLPLDGTILEWTPGSAPGEVLLVLTGWVDPPALWSLDAPTAAVTPLEPMAPPRLDLSKIEADESFALAADGIEVPLSILHRRGIPRNGANPTLLTAYGFFGISLRPTFNPAMLAWLRRGGVWAIAHPRGGGECGDGWHVAGRRLNKTKTIDDVLTCADELLARGYTSPGRIAVEGASAGGLTAGGALVRRPNLWGAAILRVPVTNSLRLEMHENGPPNIPEYGTVTSEEGLRALLLSDCYTKIQDGVAYPPVLATVGLNDQRVLPWQPAKLVARLQAATASEEPVLLRVERQAGHGVGSTKAQVDEETADRLAFLLDALTEGDPFAP